MSLKSSAVWHKDELYLVGLVEAFWKDRFSSWDLSGLKINRLESLFNIRNDKAKTRTFHITKHYELLKATQEISQHEPFFLHVDNCNTAMV